MQWQKNYDKFNFGDVHKRRLVSRRRGSVISNDPYKKSNICVDRIRRRWRGSKIRKNVIRFLCIALKIIFVIRNIFFGLALSIQPPHISALRLLEIVLNHETNNHSIFKWTRISYMKTRQMNKQRLSYNKSCWTVFFKFNEKKNHTRMRYLWYCRHQTAIK